MALAELISQWPLLLAAGTALVAWLTWWLSARHDRPRPVALLAGLRLAAVVLLTLGALNPPLRQPSPRPSSPSVTLLLDASASMALPDAGTGTRWEHLQRRLQGPGVAAALARCQSRRVLFADGQLPYVRNLKPHVPRTNLQLALEQVAAGPLPQAVVVCSDGLQTDGEALPAATALAARGTQVYAVGVGPRTSPADVALTALRVPAQVPEAQPVPVEMLVAAPGVQGRREITLTCDGKTLGRYPVSLDGRRPTRLRARLPGLAAGPHLVAASLPVQGAEATASNNQRHALVEARRDRSRVLLVAGAPGPEYAALRRVLAELPQTDVTAWVQVARGRFLKQTGHTTVPVTFRWSEAMQRQHVVLLADLEPAAADPAALAHFLRAGGALALLGGSRDGSGYGATALGTLLPARPGASYSAVPVPATAPNATTALGKALLSATGRQPWATLPFLAGHNALSGLRPDAEVVLRTRRGAPLLVSGAAGLGRALVLATPGTYRWVLSPDADAGSRSLHGEFWRSLVTWLATPPDDRQVRLLLDPPVAAYGQPSRALVQISRAQQPVTQAQVSLQVRGPSTAVTLPAAPTSVPGRYQVALSGLLPGAYQVTAHARRGSLKLGTAQYQLIVEPGGAEVAQLTRQENFLRQVAMAGGGRYAGLEEMEALLGEVAARPGPSVRLPAAGLFRTPWAMLIALALLTLDWWLRRRHGI